MAVKVINNIVGGSQKSQVNAICQAYSENMYVETVDADQASTPKALMSICGTSVLCEMPESNCRGIYRASRGYDGQPVVFAVYGSGVYVIRRTENGYEPHKIGQVSNSTNDPVSMCETGGEGSAHPHLCVCDGANLYAVDTTLTDSYMQADWRSIALPLRVNETTQHIVPTSVAYLYGYLIVNDCGTDAFYLSYQFPFETSDEYGQIDYDVFMVGSEEFRNYGFVNYADWMADNVENLFSSSSCLYVFGPRSYQIFEYNNDQNFPFTSPNTAAAAIGIKAIHSLCGVGRQVFWLGASDIGNNGVFALDGSNLTRISTPDIEREISMMRFPEDAVGMAWQENQHVFLALSFLTDKKTFVYDCREQIWHNRSSYGYGYWRPHYATFAFDNKVIFGVRDDNKLIYQDANKYTEYDGAPIVRRRVGGVIYSDYQPFYLNALHVMLNNGDITDPTIDPKVMMRFSVDGGDWSDMDIGSLGLIGQYGYCTTWWSLGFIRKMLMVEISCSDPCNFVIINAKVDADPCNMFVGG